MNHQMENDMEAGIMGACRGTYGTQPSGFTEHSVRRALGRYFSKFSAPALYGKAALDITPMYTP